MDTVYVISTTFIVVVVVCLVLSGLLTPVYGATHPVQRILRGIIKTVSITVISMIVILEIRR